MFFSATVLSWIPHSSAFVTRINTYSRLCYTSCFYTRFAPKQLQNSCWNPLLSVIALM